VAPTASAALTPGLTILVVEDRPDDAALLVRAFGDAGHQAMTASHARAAIDLARRIRFDLALVDYCLPEMHGTRLMRSLRDDGLVLPFILVTAFSTTDVVVDAMREGAYTVLDKPVPVDQLPALVREAVRTSRGATGPAAQEVPQSQAPVRDDDSGADRLARCAARLLKVTRSSGHRLTSGQGVRSYGPTGRSRGRTRACAQAASPSPAAASTGGGSAR
jgi:DNA-binding NtrC family response regulator